MKSQMMNFLRSRYPGAYRLMKTGIKSAGARLSGPLPLPPGAFIFGDQFDESFFGYYDIVPINAAGRTLVHGLTGGHSRIGVFEKDACIAQIETRAVNLQQGNRSSWLDSDRFIFNDLTAQGHLAGYLHNLQDGKTSQLSHPVLTRQDEASYWTTNFDNIARWNPDYAFGEVPGDDTQNWLGLVDLQDGSVKVQISEDEIRALLPVSLKDMFINHVFVSPDKSQIIFFVRGKSGQRIHHNIFHFVPNTQALQHLHGGRYISHPNWMDNAKFITYMELDGQTGYHITDLVQETTTQTDVFPFASDGHPTCQNGYVLTDTYPSSRGYQSLFVAHQASGETRLSQFFHHPRFGGNRRCDLHPRIDSDGNVYVDTVNNGHRQAVAFSPFGSKHQETDHA